ncbi:N-acetylmuramoyl-L-alanine amidase [Clostridium lundense]|uniref:N-acetylmuramoyl-L-alanine amidase n=1 Tax=Clostridium lundense TaxID=319475 RepID=UPI000686CA9B|nr:N-acetylmuramoyl-L-alanine amidase [Clostridium lundense]
MIKFITICTFLLAIFLGAGQVNAASNYKAWPSKDKVEQNKTWIIKFNSEIKRSSINESNIYVTSESGQTIPVNIQIAADNKSIQVSLKNTYKYESSRKYFLVVTEGVQKVSGKALADPVKMQFTIKEDTSPKPTNKDLVVCIDPGHGGKDIGITGATGVTEKDVDLSVALKAGNILEKNGVKVIYTRKDDNITWEKDDMKPRLQVLSIEKVDYLVSIHCNMASNSDANGVETFYLSGDSKGGKLADNIQKKIVSSTGIRDRGAKTGDFPELTFANVPSVKVILGFLNNPDEEKKLASIDMQNKYAQAIADGVISSREVQGVEDLIKYVSVEDIINNVTEGEKYTLPEKVKAKTKDGNVEEVSVTWGNRTVDTSKAGTYSYTGTVDGYKGTVSLALLVTSKGDSRYVVCIDPGHGGYDSGAVGPTKVKEKDVTLSVGLKVGNILQSKGVKVVYTRTSDNVSWPSNERQDLQKRCDISDSVKANYFVAIHCNSNDVAAANGTETYYSSGSAAGEKLATYVQNELIKNLGTTDRKVKTAGFYVLKNTDAPSILAELEFISNPTGEKNLNSDSFQNKCAQAIADGILKALGK